MRGREISQIRSRFADATRILQMLLGYRSSTTRSLQNFGGTFRYNYVGSSESRCTMTSRYTEELSWRIGRIPFKKGGMRKKRRRKRKKKMKKKATKIKKKKKRDGPYLRPKRRTPLRFDQIHEGPQDPFCANARGNVEKDHGTTKKRRERRERMADGERASQVPHWR